MFDIGWSELVIIGIVALIAIGPKELPGVLRSLGHWMGKIRRMAGDFQDQFRVAMREAEVADLKRQFDEASAKATAADTVSPAPETSRTRTGWAVTWSGFASVTRLMPASLRVTNTALDLVAARISWAASAISLSVSRLRLTTSTSCWPGSGRSYDAVRTRAPPC